MSKKIKAYELDQVIELLGAVQEKTDDITKRLEVIYNLGPALEEYEVDELGEILEAVSDVIEDFHYSVSSYMEGTGIEFEKEEEDIVEPAELSGLEQFLEEKFEWEDEAEEEERAESEEEEEPVTLDEMFGEKEEYKSPWE